jgi:holo-[acyl-carrier protein] synthase
MIIGIGTDICDITRIAKTLGKFGQKFKDKTFTEGEQAYCESKAIPANAYAKRFAAKEAVAKALAGEATGALSWLDVEVINQKSGRPDIQLYRTAKTRLSVRLPDGYEGKVHLSLSDDPPYAQAFAIVEAVKSA